MEIRCLSNLISFRNHDFWPLAALKHPIVDHNLFHGRGGQPSLGADGIDAQKALICRNQINEAVKSIGLEHGIVE